MVGEGTGPVEVPGTGADDAGLSFMDDDDDDAAVAVPAMLLPGTFDVDGGSEDVECSPIPLCKDAAKSSMNRQESKRDKATARKGGGNCIQDKIS